MRKLEFDDNEILSLYQELGSARKIAKEKGCSDYVIRRILKDNGIELERKNYPVSKEEEDEICELYEKYGSAYKVRDALHGEVSLPTIYKKLRKEGMIERKESKIGLQEMKEMRKYGFSYKEIGIVAEKSTGYIMKKLKE